jgi:cytochrome c2
MFCELAENRDAAMESRVLQSPSMLFLWHLAALLLLALVASVATAKLPWAMLAAEQVWAGVFVVLYVPSVLISSWQVVRQGRTSLLPSYIITISFYVCAFFWARASFDFFRNSVGIAPLLVVLALLPFVCGGRINIRKTGMLTVMALVGWGFGLSELGQSKFFEYSKSVNEVFVPSAFYNIKVREYLNHFPKRRGYGGGVATFSGNRNLYLIVNANGEMFIVGPDFTEDLLDVTRLSSHVPMNAGEFTAAAGSEYMTERFRAAGVTVEAAGDKFNIYVTHHYWKQESSCYVLRVSRMQATFDELMKPGSTISWETIFETQPCMSLKPAGEPLFDGNQVGGRVEVFDDKRVVLTVGHMGLDASAGLRNHPQDPQSSYGKVWLIDKDGSSAEMLSMGHRNPQGLYVDADNNIWSTEHGPRGGDELNLVKPNRNYGWPAVTYGTQYGEFRWSLSEEQGRHNGYEQPVYAWVPSPGISNLIRVRGDAFSIWADDLLVESLSGNTLFRVVLTDNRVVAVEPIKLGHKLRDIVEMSDGRVMIWADRGVLLTLEPADLLEDAGAYFGAACGGCHGLGDELVRAGPDLEGILNRRIGNLPGYEYSAMLSNMDDNWTAENLNAFLADPKGFAPGSKMDFGGIADPAVREMLIKFLAKN